MYDAPAGLIEFISAHMPPNYHEWLCQFNRKWELRRPIRLPERSEELRRSNWPILGLFPPIMDAIRNRIASRKMGGKVAAIEQLAIAFFRK